MNKTTHKGVINLYNMKKDNTQVDTSDEVVDVLKNAKGGSFSLFPDEKEMEDLADPELTKRLFDIQKPIADKAATVYLVMEQLHKEMEEKEELAKFEASSFMADKQLEEYFEKLTGDK